MADEQGVTVIGGVEAEVRALRNDSEKRFDSLEQSMAELKGAFGQMDRRLSNVEATVGDLRRDIRQVLFFVVGAILVPILLEVAKRMVH